MTLFNASGDRSGLPLLSGHFQSRARTCPMVSVTVTP
jgi:hypothetical protein